MKLPILIEFNSGEKATYIAQVPEWAKWEKAVSKTISQAQDSIGIWDLMFLAYHAMKREAGGKPVKNFDVWMETVAEVTVLDADPKVLSQEASTES
jgi:hypothetical protein